MTTTDSSFAQVEKRHFQPDSVAISCDSEREASKFLEEYNLAGFSLVALHGKAPFEQGWLEKPGLTTDEATQHVESGGNIGVRMGDSSAGIFGIDVDHDWEQFAKDNAELLKQVRWIRTRDGRGRILVRGEDWKGLKIKQSWGELLGNGSQSVLPPSIHPDLNTTYTWIGDPSLPIVLDAEPEDFKFPTALKKSFKPFGLSTTEEQTLNQLQEIIGYDCEHLKDKEAYFSCPRHAPDKTASFSYNLSSHKFSCFHGEGSLRGRGLDNLQQQLFGSTWRENPGNILLIDSLNSPPEDVPMILEGLWSEMTIGMLTGDGGIGKTHFVLQLLAMLAGGEQMNGIPFYSPQVRDVVYITQEDEEYFLRAELLQQQPALRDRPDVTRRIRIISTARKGENLFLNDKRLCDYISQNLSEGCVFVLDSWSTFLTSNENDNTELQRKEIAALRRIMKDRKATPLIIHHRPKRYPQNGYQASSRGGTVLPNASRFHLMLDGNMEGTVMLSFEKVSRGSKPDSIPLRFDEERKLFVPKELDRYVTAVEVGTQFTTSQFAERIGKDPKDGKQKNQVLDILRNRSKGSDPNFIKVADGRKGKDTLWERRK